MADFPNRLRHFRTARGWSQQRLADAVGCSKMQISTLERGEQSLDIVWMRRLAPPLGITPGELLLPADNATAAHSAEEAGLLDLLRRIPEGLRAQFLAVGEALAATASADAPAADTQAAGAGPAGLPAGNPTPATGKPQGR